VVKVAVSLQKPFLDSHNYILVIDEVFPMKAIHPSLGQTGESPLEQGWDYDGCGRTVNLNSAMVTLSGC
jgi:hypothetical protein